MFRQCSEPYLDIPGIEDRGAAGTVRWSWVHLNCMQNETHLILLPGYLCRARRVVGGVQDSSEAAPASRKQCDGSAGKGGKLLKRWVHEHTYRSKRGDGCISIIQKLKTRNAPFSFRKLSAFQGPGNVPLALASVSSKGDIPSAPPTPSAVARRPNPA